MQPFALCDPVVIEPLTLSKKKCLKKDGVDVTENEELQGRAYFPNRRRRFALEVIEKNSFLEIKKKYLKKNIFRVQDGKLML